MRILLIVATLALALSAPASATPALSLAKPTGDQPVGTTSLYLKDTSRPDPWVATVPYRELMVSLFYPAVGDPRIKAGIDIDGTTDDPLLAPGLDRPFLFLGRANTYTPGTGEEAGTWQRDWDQLTGWKRWLVVAGVAHPSFTDIGLVGEQLGLDFGATTPAARGQAVTAAYVRAFFEQHLEGRAQPLLDQPSPRYPEVSFAMTSTPHLPAPTGDRPVGSTQVG